MKNKLLISALVIINFFFFANQTFPWGDKGHKLISKKSVLFLPASMKAYSKWADYLEEHAPDPDNRKKDDKTEAPKHFIDIDFYKEFLAGKMIENEDSLITEYGEKEVVKQGLLPWATEETYKNLVQAFKDHNKAKALKYAADLGHYVADGHQPMHTVLNYNGQLTNQKGVHARYEINMVDDHLKELEDSFDPQPVTLVKNPQQFIFNYIYDANTVCCVLMEADSIAYKETNSRRSNAYYDLMWFRTKYITEIQFNNAAKDFAALLYTAWMNGGKPSFNKMK